MSNFEKKEVSMSEGDLAEFYRMQERHFNLLETRPGLKLKEWFGIGGFFIASAFTVGVLFAEIKSDIKFQVQKSNASFATTIHETEARWVERIGQLAEDFDSKLVSAVSSIKDEIPPPEVKLRLDQLEEDVNRLERNHPND